MDLSLPEPCGRELSLGVIGCGNMFRKCHAPAVKMLMDKGWPIKVKVLCDPSPEAISNASMLFPEANVLDDYRKLSNLNHCDAILVQLWHPRSGEAVRWLIERGIPFLAEKPVSHNVEELDEIAGLWERSKVPAAIGYNRRFQAGAEKFRQLFAGLRGQRRIQCRFLREKRGESLFMKTSWGTQLTSYEASLEILKSKMSEAFLRKSLEA